MTALEDLGYQTVWCTLNQEGEWTPLTGTTGSKPAFPATMPEPAAPHRRAIRPPSCVVFFDVDDHDGKGTGPATIKKMEAELGPLPPTWRLTSRGPGQPTGRYLYRQPDDLVATDAPFTAYGGCVETVRTGHRFSWAEGDINPRTGTPVAVYGPDGRQTAMPHMAGLPELPDAWVAYLRQATTYSGGSGEAAADASAAMDEWRKPDAEPPADITAEILAPWPAARHPELKSRCLHLAEYAAAGHPGMATLFGQLADSFSDETGRNGYAEASSLLTWWLERPQLWPSERERSGLGGGLARQAEARWAAQAPGQVTEVAEAAGQFVRPRFRVDNAAVAAELLRRELGTGGMSGLYLRDGMLVHTPRTGEDGYVMPTPDEIARGIDHGPAQVRRAEVNHVRTLAEIRYDIGKPEKVKDRESGEITETWVRSLFPVDAARHAVSAAELGIGCPNLAHLAGVTHTPVIRPDGTVLAAPGYDAATGLLYLPSGGLTVPAVPDAPTATEITAAVAFIREPVRLFPWVAAHHEANWLGVMLTPLLRLLLLPPYPMAVITATNAGSGKTMLMRLPGIVHGIATRGEFPRERDELRKLIISTLLTTTAPLIGLDNVRGTIYSSELEALLTARTLTDRELGSTRVVTVVNDRLWIATGNNARIAGDLARRCLPVAIDPQCATPHKRSFPFDPAEWMTARRGQYIAALLTVIRGWVLDGAPRAEPGRSDDYAAWYGALRGLLKWAGVPGEFGAEDAGDLSVISEDDAEWRVFVVQLATAFGESTFTARDVVSRLEAERGQPGVNARSTPLADTLPGELADKWSQAGYGKTTGFTRSLSKWLSYRDGRFTADGLTVRALRGTHRAAYQIGWPDESQAEQ